MPADRSKWPMMVKVGLWGLPSRGSAWFFVWLSLACTVGCVVAGFVVHPICFIGVLLIFAALWYFMSIRWVDQNATW